MNYKIIFILIVILIGAYTIRHDTRTFSQTKTNRVKMARAQETIDQYIYYYERLPEQLEDAFVDTAKYKYQDIWGNMLIYQHNEDGYSLTSLGHDGLVGGNGFNADISTFGP